MEEKVVGNNSQLRLTGEYTLHVNWSACIRDRNDKKERCRNGQIAEVGHQTEQLTGRQSSTHGERREMVLDGRRDVLAQVTSEILLWEGGI